MKRFIVLVLAALALHGAGAATAQADEADDPGVIVLAATFDEPDRGIGRVPEWLGWPASRTLRVTVANTGEAPVDGVRVDVRSATTELPTLAPGEQRTVAIDDVQLGAFDFGRHVHQLDVLVPGQRPIEFTAATSNWPWISIGLLLLGATGSLTGWRARRRGEHRLSLAVAVTAGAWTALALAVGIAGATVLTARRADATAEAAQARLMRELDAAPAAPVETTEPRTVVNTDTDSVVPAVTTTTTSEPIRFAPAPAMATPALGDPLGVLRIPRLGTKYAFASLEGVRDRDLAAGPGHYPGTALPGEVGNFVLSAHRTSHLAPFADLDELHVGDEIRFAAGGGTFIYAVTGSRVVPPTALEVLLPEPGRRTMTLITCHPEHSTKERLVVAADFVGFSPAG